MGNMTHQYCMCHLYCEQPQDKNKGSVPYCNYIFKWQYFFNPSTLLYLAHSKPTLQAVGDHQIDLESYLQRYGYLKETSTTDVASLSMSAFAKRNRNKAALQEYQKFMGLEVTGEFDEATKKLMAKPRCGVEDRPKGLNRGTKKSLKYPNTDVWNKTDLTYRLRSFASYDNILRPVQESILDDAFFEWSKYVPLTFEKVCETCSADIVIEFIDDEHDSHVHNGRQARFPPDDVGHAASPLFAYPAFVHFNKQFTFSESYASDDSRKNLFHVAIHEIGHTLGLDHFEGSMDSVMYSAYPDPYDRSREDYLTVIDQRLIQQAYGKRKESVVGSCSTWSAEPQRLELGKSHSPNQPLSLGSRVNNAAKTQQMLERFLANKREKYLRASQRLKQQENSGSEETTENDYEAGDSDDETRSMIQVDHMKTSGSAREDEFGDIQANFLDRFDNLYVSDYLHNQVVKYDATAKAQQRTVVAESLSAPRGIYVTNNGSELYVADSKGIHRFKLDVKKNNLGASSLLFCLDSSSEIFSIIVDEDDFKTIYLYDTGRRNIQRCRHTPHRWECDTIVNLTVESIDGNEQMSMVFETNGDLSVEGAAKNAILRYKHNKDGCDSIPDEIQSTSSTEILSTRRLFFSKGSSSTTQPSTSTQPPFSTRTSSSKRSSSTVRSQQKQRSDGTCSANRPCYAKDACCSSHGYCGYEVGHCGFGCINGPCHSTDDE